MRCRLCQKEGASYRQKIRKFYCRLCNGFFELNPCDEMIKASQELDKTRVDKEKKAFDGLG